MGERVVRWGIVGAGRIAQRFARSLAREPRSELVAISCRSAAKADAFAAAHGVNEDGTLSDEALGGVAGSAHAALLARPDVDAVYVALPPALHLEWSVAALRAGKAVLCEKPLCASVEETERLVRTAAETGTLLMEGTKTRFEPLYRSRPRARGPGRDRAADAGGDPALQRHGATALPAAPTICPTPWAAATCSTQASTVAAWLDDYLTGPIEVVATRARWSGGVDTFADAELRAGNVTARLLTACDQGSPRDAIIVGTEGRVVVDEMHRPQHARLERTGERPVELDLPYPVDDLYGEVEHFAGLVLAGGGRVSRHAARDLAALRRAPRRHPGADGLARGPPATPSRRYLSR